ncbi:MAG: restriction endonuclease PLD domain-containing protein [Gammaproteobacteria bacterium]
MKLILHDQNKRGSLDEYYRRAFEQATELFIVTAYLPAWDNELQLNETCRGFRLIIGKDFGITRKAACESVMQWLPAKRNSQFLVADLIAGFHPKAVFWSEGDNKYYAIVGSSNLTRAAFETNYEANVYSKISKTEYAAAKEWVKHLECKSIVVSSDWLSKYHESTRAPGSRRASAKDTSAKDIALIALKLPKPRGTEKQVEYRRRKLQTHEKKQAGLTRLFVRCANREIESREFYEQLPNYWSYKIGNRLQGHGFEISGAWSDFTALSQSFIRITRTDEDDRDDVVAEEIDRLQELSVATRAAFLSEMLCLRFRKLYPVLNAPVRKFLTDKKFKPPSKASEGARYIDLAKKLRFSLLQNPEHAAKDLAELDAVIWLAYGKKKK